MDLTFFKFTGLSGFPNFRYIWEIYLIIGLVLSLYK